MDETEESWYPHLLGFILPLVTIAGLYLGGWWCFAGFVYGLGLCPILDFVFPERIPTRKKSSPTAWNSLLFAHGIFMYASIFALLWRTNIDGFGLFVILGAISVGAVSGVSGIVNAHEAGHRKKGSWIWRIARLNLLLVLYLHFTTEHNHGHHRHYSTDKDPASSPRNRGFWTQLLMTIPLQYIASWKTHSQKGRTVIMNPIFHGIMLQITLLFGIWWYSQDMFLAFIIQAAIAITLLEYVNYLQHYGLRKGADERHTMMHSWEYRGSWSRWTLLELPLHPSHHLMASTTMWNLRAQEGSPQLPYGYYACFWLVAFPPLWKRLMGKRLDEIQN